MVMYKSYQHIEKMGSSEIDGILIGDVSVFTKMDGTNFTCFLKDDGTLGCGSRNREISLTSDNQGACAWAYSQDNILAYLKKHPKHILYGEFMVKHLIRTYEDDVWKKAFVFDVFDTETNKYLSYEEYKPLLEEFSIEYIPRIAKLHNPTMEEVESYVDKCDFKQVGDNMGEGCFKGTSRVLMADGTVKKIRDISVGDYVKSYNTTTKEIENKRVSNVFYNGRKDRFLWNHVVTAGKNVTKETNGNKAFWATKNHKFFDGKGFSEIGKYVYMYKQEMDAFRQQAFLGMMCTDGCTSKGVSNFSQLASKIADFETIFEGFIGRTSYRTSGKGSNIGVFYFKREFTNKFDAIYGDGNGSLDKVKIFENLDVIGWSYAFMCDGCYGKDRDFQISIASFSLEDANRILKAFNKTFGVVATLKFDRRVSNNVGASIRVKRSESDKVLDKIVKYILPNYKYKVELFSHDTYVEYPPSTKNFELSKIGVRNIFDGANHNEYKYHKNLTFDAWDLEVEDNHDYFVEGVLVHNCVYKNFDYRTKWGHIIWGKIVRAEYKQKNKAHVTGTVDIETDIIDKYCTDAFVLKEVDKIYSALGTWDNKYIGRYINTVWHEFITENMWDIIKKCKNPTINFRVMFLMCQDKTKAIMKSYFKEKNVEVPF